MNGWFTTHRSAGKVLVENGVVTFYFGVSVPDSEDYTKKSSKFGSFVLLRQRQDKHRLLGVEFLPKLYQDRELLRECSLAERTELDGFALLKLAEAVLWHKQGSGNADELKKERRYINAIRTHLSRWRYPPLPELTRAAAA
jgi:hypothetical protein